jgi:hypothetical protein
MPVQAGDPDKPVQAGLLRAAAMVQCSGRDGLVEA